MYPEEIFIVLCDFVHFVHKTFTIYSCRYKGENNDFTNIFIMSERCKNFALGAFLSSLSRSLHKQRGMLLRLYHYHYLCMQSVNLQDPPIQYSNGVYLKNLIIWNKKYNVNPFFNLTFSSIYCILSVFVCALFCNFGYSEKGVTKLKI